MHVCLSFFNVKKKTILFSGKKMILGTCIFILRKDRRMVLSHNSLSIRCEIRDLITKRYSPVLCSWSTNNTFPSLSFDFSFFF